MPFIGNQPTQGRFIELDSLTASATANYTLQLNSANFSPESVNNLLVSINGVIQGSSTMSLNGAVLTVGATLSSSDTIDFVRVFGNVGTVSTPTDGSVTTNKIGTGAVVLTSKVSGVLPVANGGTGVSSGFSYTEGTWTPTNASSNHFHSTVNITNANYTKIGRAVFLNFQINMASSSGNIGSDSYFSIGALPFTLNSVAGGTATVSTNLTTGGYVTGVITGFSGDTTVYVNFSGVISGTVPRSNHVTGQFTYFTNE